MIYLSIALGLLLIVQHFHYERRLDRFRAEQASREISLLNRIQAPERAVAESIPIDPNPEPNHLPVDDTPYADNVWDLFQEENS